MTILNFYILGFFVSFIFALYFYSQLEKKDVYLKTFLAFLMTSFLSWVFLFILIFIVLDSPYFLNSDFNKLLIKAKG